ncbi:MAG: TIGR03560 family F420-dependent LLM class oxidoreductase [Thermomicrobiales bacterium]|nr:TIGR03560 family F420-dependent LLM class oxidoreductase [Thermomicrobiales bacterium]MCO5222463.1 TIGR03560 family F420-dependent LLM class oxidoreductase [Thermomicrobiales bacterium]
MAEFRHPLTFGVVIAQHQYTWPELISQWKLAEELGFDSIWLFDHFMALYADPDGPCLETSTLLAALAQETSRAKIGVLVYGNTHRHPSVLAKEIVTVDHVSNGRAILGIGAGWNEREHRAYGIPFPSAGDRVEMLDEALQIMELLFSEQRTTFDGAHYQLEDAPFAPKPVQDNLPVLIGGTRPRMLKVIARHADIWDTSRDPDQLREGLAQIAEHCAEIGRDPAEIAVSSSFGADRLEHPDGFEDLIRSYRAAGSSQFLFDFPLGGEGLESAKRLATDVMPKLRDELA